MDPLLHTRDERTVKTMDFTKPAPKKAKTVKSAGKVMATVFWDARDIIHIDYLLSSKRSMTITMQPYWIIQHHFKEKTCSHLAKKKMLFSLKQTCTGSHVPDGQIQWIPNCFPIQHSPDLAPCNCFQTWRNGSEERESLPENSSSPKEGYFERLDKSYYSDGLKKLENRWLKCIELKGDYVEK